MTKKVEKKVVAKKVVAKKVAKKKVKSVGPGSLAKVVTKKAVVSKEEKETKKLHNKLVKFCEKNNITIVGAVCLNALDVYSFSKINENNSLETQGLKRLLERSL